MFSKIAIACVLVAVAVARPDKPPTRGYSYDEPSRPFVSGRYDAPEAATTTTERAPEAPRASYQAPQPTYQAPQPTYQAPQRTYQAPQPTYQAPEESDEEPEVTYAAPAAPRATYAAPKSEESEEDAPLMPFDFGYIVENEESGSDEELAYGHKSNSDGQQVTGQYRVLLPDGRTQIVTYTADKEHGYRADVTYEGEARPWVPPQADDDDDDDDASYAAPSAPRSAYSAPQ
ncbi:Cuticle Protein CPR RR Uncl [Hyalella azteca]|uniref:Cuticle Protein CPR RR Uncl n=1 Tax=Hyalella azteca TaxID=294128 RepID=A0A6A0H972_HYAAZ|nr:cuticle protein 18.6 [Hyalella azteca]KAA0202308.1 Cuticle Protein CPR RR Uncl [Hyalella azteca]